MTFSDALVMLKAGYKVARAGWNGKGMFIFMVPGTEDIEFTPMTAYSDALEGVENGNECREILPHIDMYTINAQGRRAMLPGWLASQSDMLSEDWCISE